MNKCVLTALLLAFLSAAFARAEDGVPSASKLSKMGLSSMSVVSDARGMEVRGLGIGLVGGRFFSLAGPSVALAQGGLIAGPNRPAVGTFGTINPATGVNTPFTANYAQAGGPPFLVITASTYGQVSGISN